MKRSRSPGAGSVERLPSGKFRARFPGDDGRRRTLGIFETEEEAEKTLDAAMAVLADGKMASTGSMTLGAYGRGFLDARERADGQDEHGHDHAAALDTKPVMLNLFQHDGVGASPCRCLPKRPGIARRAKERLSARCRTIFS